MADAELNIKVLVETGKVGELKDAVKLLNQQIAVASREELPGLIKQKEQLTQTLNTLVPKHNSFTQSIREARTEARSFRFALLEMTHGIDGLVVSFGAFTGAGEGTKESLKAFSENAKEALGAGLGLKFGLEAMGGTMAAIAPEVALIVGALTLLGTIVASNQEKIAKQNAELDKAISRNIKLRYELGLLSRAEYLNDLQADILLAKQKLREAQAATHIDWLASIRARKLIYDVKASAVEIENAQGDVLDKEKIYKEAQENFTKIDAKGEEDRIKQEDANLKVQTANYSAQMDEKIRVAKEAADKLKSIENFMNSPKEVKVHEAPAQRKESFEDIMGGWMTGIGILQEGFANLANGISQGLSNAFGEANSLFEMFVEGVIQGIARIATELASAAIISGIFSLLGIGTGGIFGSIFSGLTGFATGGTLYEPVMGVGKSGTMYSFAENGPERYSPITSGGGGSQSMRIYGETQIKNGHLVTAWKNGRTLDRMQGANY